MYLISFCIIGLSNSALTLVSLIMLLGLMKKNIGMACALSSFGKGLSPIFYYLMNYFILYFPELSTYDNIHGFDRRTSYIVKEEIEIRVDMFLLIMTLIFYSFAIIFPFLIKKKYGKYIELFQDYVNKTKINNNDNNGDYPNILNDLS